VKVSELIERLQRCDPDLPVMVAYQDETAVPAPQVVLDGVVSVGTDNAPRSRVLIANADMPSLTLPNPAPMPFWPR
jgi:hypothetical protein